MNSYSVTLDTGNVVDLDAEFFDQKDGFFYFYIPDEVYGGSCPSFVVCCEGVYAITLTE